MPCSGSAGRRWDALTMLRVGGGARLGCATGFIAMAVRHLGQGTTCPAPWVAVLAHRLAPGADTYLLVSSRLESRASAAVGPAIASRSPTGRRRGTWAGALLCCPRYRTWARCRRPRGGRRRGRPRRSAPGCHPVVGPCSSNPERSGSSTWANCGGWPGTNRPVAELSARTALPPPRGAPRWPTRPPRRPRHPSRVPVRPRRGPAATDPRSSGCLPTCPR